MLSVNLLIAQITATPPGYDTGWRTRPFFICSHCRGESSDGVAVRILRRGQDDLPVPANRFFMLPPNTLHRAVTTGDHITSHWFHFNAYSEMGTELSQHFRFPVVFQVDPVFRETLDRLIAAFQDPALPMRLAATAECAMIINLMLRQAEPDDTFRSGELLERIMPALKAVRAHPAQHYSNVELAKLCYLSESRFRVIFQKVLGSSPHSFQESLRIREAISLLLNGETLDKIASTLHYTDVSHFSRCFRKVIGLAPGNYRSRMQSGKA